jgi:predicted dehydrogenase
VNLGDPPEIGIGMLGYAFMGKAHANAFRKIGYMTWPPPLRPRLVAIAGRNEEAVSEAARRYGFERSTLRWEELVADPEIGLLDNLGPNAVHAEPTIAAAEAGKHVICEKPLGRDADESYEIWRRVATAGVKHMCAFNYRFVPAVRLARELIEAGELGDLRHFRGRYLQDWGDTTDEIWRFDRETAGSGALGDLATHVIDLARYLVGEIEAVGGFLRTFVPGREVDDAVEATVEFESGAVGTLEATRLALGRRNSFQWEINGTKGSVYFDMERLNELQVFRSDGDRARGFRNVLVTETDHPFWEHWWPPGHIIGWGETFVHELHHFLAAIADGTDVAPHAATFEDGYRAAEVADAIVRSSESGKRERIAYRELERLLGRNERPPEPGSARREAQRRGGNR